MTRFMFSSSLESTSEHAAQPASREGRFAAEPLAPLTSTLGVMKHIPLGIDVRRASNFTALAVEVALLLQTAMARSGSRGSVVSVLR